MAGGVFSNFPFKLKPDFPNLLYSSEGLGSSLFSLLGEETVFLCVVFFFFPPSVTEFWKLTDVDNELCVLHEGQFLIALGLVSVTSKKGKVNEENSLGNHHVSAHSTQNKDAELK